MKVTVFMIIVGIIFLCIFVGLLTLIVRALLKYIHSKDVRQEKSVVRKSLGEALKVHRTQCKMTQEFVAETIGVSRQAVSKWERDLSYPDINTIPKLADLFDASVDELMQGQTVMKENKKNRKSDIVDTVLRGLGVAMGIVVVVLSALGKVDTKAALTMLGLGLASLSISSLKDKNE